MNEERMNEERRNVERRNEDRRYCQQLSTFITRQLIIDIIIWCLVCMPVLGLFLAGSPFKLGFHCDDRTIQYPYHHDSVSVPVLLAGGLGIPFITIIATEVCRMLTRSRNDKRPSEIWMAAKGIGLFLFGTMVAKVFTEVIKFSTGRLRPHFIDLCRPDFSKINCSIGYIMEYDCTNNEVSDKLLRDSRLSFPSGHSSFATFSAVFVVLYLQYRMVVSSSHLLRPVLQLAVILLAVWCGVTRVTDNKHFTSDVLGGSILGGGLACIIFYMVALPHLKEKKRAEMGENSSSYIANSELESSTPSPLLRKENKVITLKEPVFRTKSVV